MSARSYGGIHQFVLVDWLSCSKTYSHYDIELEKFPNTFGNLHDSYGLKSEKWNRNMQFVSVVLFGCRILCVWYWNWLLVVFTLLSVSQCHCTAVLRYINIITVHEYNMRSSSARWDGLWTCVELLSNQQRFFSHLFNETQFANKPSL